MNQGVHRFLRIPVAQYSTVRELLDTIAEPVESAKDMFKAQYSATGLAPATHLISSGLIDSKFASIIGNAAVTNAVYNQRCTVLGKIPTITLAQITALYAACDIRTDTQGLEATVLDLMGMKPVTAVV